jgi:polar amino acid transport system substrate-binding protein
MRGRPAGAIRTGILVALLVLAGGACNDVKRAATGSLAANASGALTVATELPAPGFWEGTDPATVDGGFEWGLAHALAKELGRHLTVQALPFVDIVAGRLGTADLALAQVSATDERRRVAELTAPYLESAPAVLARTGAEKDLVDLATARHRRWAVQGASTFATYLADVVRPHAKPLVLSTMDQVVQAVIDRRVDAALLDLPTALAVAKKEGLSVPARFDQTEHIVGVLPDGSPNLDAIDTALRRLTADGTVDRLRKQWLEPSFVTDPDDVPVISARA